MVRRLLILLWKKFHNIFTVWGAASLCFGAAMYLTGTFLPAAQWAWVTPQLAGILSIIGFVFFGLAFLLIIVGIVRTKANEATPKFALLFGIKQNIWRMYKLQQGKVETAGAKGLTKPQRDMVLATMRRDMRVTPTVVFKPLTDEQAKRVIAHSNKKLGIKGGEALSKKAQNELNTAGIAIDKCGVGVSSLLQGDTEYDEVSNKINADRLQFKKDKQIKALKGLAYSLNTVLLAILYFEPVAKEIAPTVTIPHGLMKDTLDEEIQRALELL